MKVEDYLKKHFVKDNGFSKEYNTVKECMLGSVDGTITYYDDTTPGSWDNYFRFGCNSKEYHEQYKKQPDFQELPFF